MLGEEEDVLLSGLTVPLICILRIRAAVTRISYFSITFIYGVRNFFTASYYLTAFL